VLAQQSEAGLGLSVAEVVALGRLPHRGAWSNDRPQDSAAVAKALLVMGLTALAHQDFATLSGGEMQRVRFARALAQEPGLLILDEPTNHLDVRHQLEMLSVASRLGVTVVATLHEHRLSEQGRDLRPAVQGLSRDNPQDRGHSPASRRSHWLHVGTAHVGLRADAPPACAHGRAGWRPVARRIEVDRVPTALFLPVEVLSALFRRLFLEMLVAARDTGHLQFFGDHAPLADKAAFHAYLSPLRKIDWVVYTKEPFAGPEQVLRYLSRYTHRVAISNHRLISADQTSVTFKWKDYRIEGPGRYKTMTLATDEFIRRFLMHVLPKGVHRIRHCGLLANGNRAANIARARELLAMPLHSKEPQTSEATTVDEPCVLPLPCPCCGGRMIIIETFARGGEPKHRPTRAPAAIRIDTS
jgi:Putative transposase/ABC transporter